MPDRFSAILPRKAADMIQATLPVFAAAAGI
jgi:hypothetical protein